MKKLLSRITILVFTASLLWACGEDTVPVTEFTLTVTLPESMGTDVKADGLTIELTNTVNSIKTTGTTDSTGKYVVSVEEGVYNIHISGEKTFSTTAGTQTFDQTVNLSAVGENISITGATFAHSLTTFISIASSGWVFKELYFTGSQTPEGKVYYKDKYFEIYNNSNEVLYADGLSFCEGDHLSSNELNEWASIIDAAFVAHTIYSVPGNGTTYPVQPGKSVIIADIAIDHRTSNANSFDLSKANFEWYDNHSLDVDVPETPNMIRHFSYSASIWTPHNRGFKAYVIFKPEGTMEAFMATNNVDKTTANGSVITRYKIPNNLILDAVELGTPSDFLSKALSPALDISYTHCGDGDNARYGKCVRRKVSSVVDGRVVYQDTNNSAVDFNATVTPQPGIFQ
jgi:hypothetical protein